MRRPQAGHSIKYVVVHLLSCRVSQHPLLTDLEQMRSWVSQLDHTFAKQGLSDINFTRYEIAPKDYFYWNLNRLWSAEELGKNVHLDGARTQDISSMIAETFIEFQQGVALTADLVVTIGKKPLSEGPTCSTQTTV